MDGMVNLIVGPEYFIIPYAFFAKIVGGDGWKQRVVFFLFFVLSVWFWASDGGPLAIKATEESQVILSW